MDDMTAFERLVAGRTQHHAGPIRPVNDAAIFTAITASQSPRWRFQSMFSATKFVVAGAIVALFGGLLLAGLLTQPSEESEPAVGVSASASPSALPDMTPVGGVSGGWPVMATDDALWWSDGDRLTRIDAVTSEVRHIPTVSEVAGLEPTDDAVWVIGEDGMDRIDRNSLLITDTVDVIGGPSTVVDGSLWLWSLGPDHSSLIEVDLDTASVVDEYPVDGQLLIEASESERAPWDVAVSTRWMAVVDDALLLVQSEAWPTGDPSDPYIGPRVTRFDLQTREVTDRLDVDPSDELYDAIVLGDAMWLQGPVGTGTLRHFDAATLRVTDTIQVADTPDRDAPRLFLGPAAAGALWVATFGDRLYRVDPVTGEVTEVAGIAGAWPEPVAGNGGIWIGGNSGTLLRIDAGSLEATEVARVPEGHYHTYLSDGVVWAVTERNGLYRLDVPAGVEPVEEAEATDATSPDLLPGVDLVTEEVEPGVYRVLSDGTDNDMGAWSGDPGGQAQVHAGQDGSLWVAYERLGRQRLFKVGVEGDHPPSNSGYLSRLPRDLAVAADGVIWVQRVDGARLYSLDDDEWTAHPGPDGTRVGSVETAADGSVWATWEVAAGENEGQHRAVTRYLDGEWQREDIGPGESGGEVSLAFGPEGTMLIRSTYHPEYGPGYGGRDPEWVGVLERKDDGWEQTYTAEEDTFIGPTTIGRDGTVWAYRYQDTAGGPGVSSLLRRGRDGWETLGEDGSVPLLESADVHTSSLTTSDDGRLWVALGGQDPGVAKPDPDGPCVGVLSYDGANWSQVLAGGCATHVSTATNGNVWATLLDPPDGATAHPAGLYVITPEAVVAAE